MASTRNNNTKSDYDLQQSRFNKTRDYSIPSRGNTVINVSYPTFGINYQRAPAIQLSNNSTDLESDLFGIGSTNLVNPRKPYKEDMKSINETKFIDRLELFVPQFNDSKNQRPMFK
jgi:hypothetical protein|tara:strand:+ start:146 stop:493 length:348 start_codon:yes stop_codon:yes gene_type:complete